MDPLTYIKSRLKSILERSKVPSPELDAVADELVPSVLLILATDHEDTLQSIKDEVSSLDDNKLTEHPQMKRILDDSIEKIARTYDATYTDISLTNNAKTIVTNDIQTLLKQDPAFWERVQKKTYQEVMNDARPGSNDERVFLWLEEIKKATGVSPEINEAIGVYSTRAIAYFLRSQAGL